MSEETRSDPPERGFPYENEVPLDPPELDLDSPTGREAGASRRSRRGIPPPRAAARTPAPRVEDDEDRERLVDSLPMRGLGFAVVVGIATVVGGIMGAQDVSGWEIGLVVSITTLVLLGILFMLRAR